MGKLRKIFYADHSLKRATFTNYMKIFRNGQNKNKAEERRKVGRKVG